MKKKILVIFQEKGGVIKIPSLREGMSYEDISMLYIFKMFLANVIICSLDALFFIVFANLDIICMLPLTYP